MRGSVTTWPSTQTSPARIQSQAWVREPQPSLARARYSCTRRPGWPGALATAHLPSGPVRSDPIHRVGGDAAPREIERALSTNGSDLSGEAKEAFLVELYRQDRISHHQFTEALGLSRLETEGVLKRHKVSSGVTAAEMRAQAAALRDARP